MSIGAADSQYGGDGLRFRRTRREADDSRHADGTPREMSYPSGNTRELLGHAPEALRRIYRRGYQYQKAGVML